MLVFLKNSSLEAAIQNYQPTCYQKPEFPTLFYCLSR